MVYVTAADNAQYEPRGYGALRQSSATKGSAALAETPQFVSVIRRDQLDTLPGESLSKALRYSAGVTSEKYGAFGNGIDYSKMRGFDADYYLDGLRVAGNSGIWGAQVDSWLPESVEAVHGPSSALYGQGGAGGVINMQSRLPRAEESHQIQFQSGNYDNNALRFDSTGALNEDETWLYRMTGSAASSGSQIENTKQSRYLIAPSVTRQPLNNLSWTVAGVYQHDPYVGYYNTLPAAALGLLPSPYGSLDRHRNYSNPDHEKSGRTQQSVTSLVSWQVSDSLTLKQNLRYADVKTHIRRDFIRGFVQDGRLLTAVYQDSPSRARTLAADNQLIYKTLTGPVSPPAVTKAYTATTVRNTPTLMAVKCGYQCPFSASPAIRSPAPRKRYPAAPVNRQPKCSNATSTSRTETVYNAIAVIAVFTEKQTERHNNGKLPFAPVTVI